MATKAKEVTKTEINDNGEVKEPTIQEALESIRIQANGALQERNKQDDLYKRCLGAIEVLEKMVKREEDNSSSD